VEIEKIPKEDKAVFIGLQTCLVVLLRSNIPQEFAISTSTYNATYIMMIA